ncbi:fumarate hydratase C-terminal domain-containing protein [Thermococcus sp. JCM 11816]|uniref:fumarate hydratase C-terminal domain-containing protein n=1 Tax=Thermococcus sp. (strain JCM 11816 / KS-1) TaxID=1295125 RepID=UPI0034671F96
MKTPPLGEEVLELRAGDVVYLSGRIYTARDAAHRKIIELSKRGELPFELEAQ